MVGSSQKRQLFVIFLGTCARKSSISKLKATFNNNYSAMTQLNLAKQLEPAGVRAQSRRHIERTTRVRNC